MTHDKIYIYGKHAVMEALINAPEKIEKVFLSFDLNSSERVGQDDDKEINSLIARNKIPSLSFDAKNLPREIDKEANHQGIVAIISSSDLVRPYKNFIENLKIDKNTALCILDEIE